MGKTVGGLVGGLLVGVLAGGAAGAKLGQRSVVDTWARTDANEATSLVERLDALRGAPVQRLVETVRAARGAEPNADAPGSALEGLEHALDVRLFGLRNAAESGASPDVLAQAEQAVTKARDYRARHPRSATDALGRDVAAWLAQAAPAAPAGK